MLLKDEVDATAVRSLAERLLRALRTPFPMDGMQPAIGGSIGIALYPRHGEDSHVLLRSADVAMYGAKHGGLGLRTYDPDLDQHTPRRLAMISDLDQVVREQQFLLRYRPKLDLRSGQIMGFEALVRWQHPRLGLLHPGDFLALAEAVPG